MARCAVMAGYSGTPLAQKLGIKPGHSVEVLGAPDGLDAVLADTLPGGVTVRTRASGPFEVILTFHTRRADLEKRVPVLLRALPEAARDLDVKGHSPDLMAPEYPCGDANRRNARLDPAGLLGRVLPSEDRGGAGQPVRDRAVAARARARLRLGHLRRRRRRPATGTVEITRAIKDELRLEVMAHLSCVGETTEGLRRSLDRIADGRDREHPRAARRPAARRGRLRAARGRPRQRRRARRAITERLRLHDRRRLLPRGPSRGPRASTADLAYLKTKVDAGASFLITQLFFDNQLYFDFVAGGAARRASTCRSSPGVIPMTSFAQTRRICDLCEATIPAPLAAAMEALDGDERGRVRARRRLRDPAVRRAAAPRSAGHPLLRAQPLAGRRARSSARCSASRPWEDARQAGAAAGRPEAPPTLAAPCPSSTTRATGSRTTSTARATARSS